MNFKRYINLHRMEQAQKLIREDGMSIEKAALASGFGSARNFYLVRKSLMGHPPASL